MKYVFVTLSILAVWVAIIIVVGVFGNDSIFLPIVALVMTVVLFVIGFVRKK